MTTQTVTSSPPTGQARPWWVFPTLLVAFLVLALLAFGLYESNRAQVSEGPAPDFTLHTFDGDTFTMGALQGKPVVINFWASWCIECDREMPVLEEAYQRHKDEVVFLGVDYLDTEEKALAYLSRFGTSYPNGPDIGSRISDAYRIKGVPETFFIGKDGTIRGVHIGPVDEATLEGWIAKLRSE